MQRQIAFRDIQLKWNSDENGRHISDEFSPTDAYANEYFQLLDRYLFAGLLDRGGFVRLEIFRSEDMQAIINRQAIDDQEILLGFTWLDRHQPESHVVIFLNDLSADEFLPVGCEGMPRFLPFCVSPRNDARLVHDIFLQRSKLL